jgi:hypothetical protein
MRYLRRLALGSIAALLVLICATAASAQTVAVIKAPAGSTVEVVFNSTKVGSAIADARGGATIDTNKLSEANQQLSVRLAVDLCQNAVRVQMIDAGVMTPPEGGCTRREIAGLYVMRRITTFVIDVGEKSPTVWVAQGPAPKPWLDPNAPVGSEARGYGVLPKGLVLGGGGGLTHFSNAVSASCGNVTDCSRTTGQWGLNAAATVWLTTWLGAEVGMLNPLDLKVSGSGTGYRFQTTLETRMLTIVGKVAASGGPARVYGFAGLNYHWITSNTAETIDPSTITVNGTTVPVPGGTQNYGVSAPGWGWHFGGGLELWIKKRFAIFGEGGWIPLKENNEFGGEAKIDDRVIYIIGGVRIHVLP